MTYTCHYNKIFTYLLIAQGYLWLQIINCYVINQQFAGCFLQSGQLSNNKTLIFTLKVRVHNLRMWL